MTMDFNPRFPRGKRQRRSRSGCSSRPFQSTLPAGEATVNLLHGRRVRDISIHASRGGSDRFVHRLETCAVQISIHASRGGSDPIGLSAWRPSGFQSTLPAGEATALPPSCRGTFHDFNPRFPRGKRRSWTNPLRSSSVFQSTLPAGEATR